MKSIMVIGDSISMQYGPFLERYVDGRFLYSRLSERDSQGQRIGKNAADSEVTLQSIRDEQPQQDQWDYLLLNCGLHDIKTPAQDSSRQVSISRYRQNVTEIADLMTRKANVPVWVRTTPVHDNLHRQKKPFLRFDEDVQAYNEVADTIMTSRGIRIADLYQFTRSIGNDIREDGVHFVEATRIQQAAFLCGYIDSVDNDELRGVTGG